jgi:hypothetical protein
LIAGSFHGGADVRAIDRLVTVTVGRFTTTSATPLISLISSVTDATQCSQVFSSLRGSCGGSTCTDAAGWQPATRSKACGRVAAEPRLPSRVAPAAAGAGV